MPEKLDRCVKKLVAKGYTEEQAWAICKKQIESDAINKYEAKKAILTGQLIKDQKEEEQR